MTTGVNPGDKLRAYKIAVEAMSIVIKPIFHRTGAHRGQRAVAERNVECVILKKMVLAKPKATPSGCPRRGRN